MAQVVAAISMSHAPGITGWPDAPAPAVRQRVGAGMQELAAYLDAARPDVIVALLDDHFENHYRNLMPTFAVAIAPSHKGPAEYWLEALRLERQQAIPGAPELATSLLGRLVHGGFDAARMGEIEYGNNLMVPLALIRPQADIPVIPVFINVFTPPLPKVRRAYALGEAIRQSVEEWPRDLRVAFLATGGLSHWPPFWQEKSPASDRFLQRMKRYQTEGRAVLAADPDLMVDLGAYEIEMARQSNRPLVNPQWDRSFLDMLARGDVAGMWALGYDEVEEQAGHGGHEILNWVAVMGAMRGRPARIVLYEEVIEWITGVALAVYDIPAPESGGD